MNVIRAGCVLIMENKEFPKERYLRRQLKESRNKLEQMGRRAL